MRLISLDEAKRIMLEILIQFDLFCKKNSLNYTLSDGTLLGAVRHKGFIPWDDDIDVTMPRNDFDKFQRLYKSEKYKIITAEDGSRFPFFFMRLTDSNTKLKFHDTISGERRNSYYEGGVFIDIFPVDNLPDNTKEAKKHVKKTNWWLNLYMKKVFEPKIFSKMGKMRNYYWLTLHFLTSMIPHSFFKNKIYNLMTKYNEIQTRAQCVYPICWHEPFEFPSVTFSSYCDMVFENRIFTGIKNYDIYLKTMFGDYLTLPPKEKRVAHHDYDTYII